MDRLTAECFLNSIWSALYQATQRGLAKEELVELSKTLQLVMQGIPGDAKVNEEAKAFCTSVYASGLFHGTIPAEKLVELLKGAEALQALMDSGLKRSAFVGHSPQVSHLPASTGQAWETSDASSTEVKEGPHVSG